MADKEVQRAPTAVLNLVRESAAVAYALGNYLAIPEPRKRHHDALRAAGANCVAAAREALTALEGVRRLGVKAEADESGALQLIGDDE